MTAKKKPANDQTIEEENLTSENTSQIKNKKIRLIMLNGQSSPRPKRKFQRGRLLKKRA